MRNAPSGGAAGRVGEATSAPRNEWTAFLALAFLGLPIAMSLAIAAFGFVVWLLQILFFGPPS